MRAVHTTPMRILVVHTAYQQRGGEESVVESEIDLLRSYGHPVDIYRRDNAEIDTMAGPSLAAQTLWSRRTVAEMDERISRFRPALIHAHNTFPLISPSLYWAASAAGVPVVQTLHNFRLLCPQAMLLRKEKPCEACLGKLPWRGVIHRCYRGSLAKTGVLAGMLTAHWLLGTYTRKVTSYIAINSYCRNIFVQGGLPAEKIVIKPHFVDISLGEERQRSGGLFVGRVAPEKGISILLDAMNFLSDYDLTVVGTGPDEAKVRSSHVRYLGFANQSEVYEHMRRASYLVLPSIWYEHSPRTLIEAFGCGLPVIGSRLGSIAEVIEDGRTGLLFEPHSAKDLAAKIDWAERHPHEMAEMGRNARTEFEKKYTPEKNYKQLVEIYGRALTEHKHA